MGADTASNSQPAASPGVGRNAIRKFVSLSHARHFKI